ncbi:MAG: hypothetical protein RBS19_08505 [Bacteroidales bacterium]|nr:hypothetical protein [Bacteroidales bacterium]
MKKVLVLMLCLCVLKVVDSQNKIEGIGVFKIGKTKIKIINQIAEDNNTVLKWYSDYSDTEWLKYFRGIEIAELFPNLQDSSKNPLRTSYCPNVRVFFINAYKIAGINLLNIHLRFYNDKLIEFYCDYSNELLDALSIKYGKPKKNNYLSNCSVLNKSNRISYSCIYWENKTIIAGFNKEERDSVILNSYFILTDTTYFKINSDCEIKKKETYLNDLRKKVLNDLQKKVLKDL